MLSIRGKQVFIKLVLQEVPTFTMMYFLLSKTLYRDIEGLIAYFLWQKSGVQRGLHWCEWSMFCTLKEDGGMGFHDLGKFNIALLTKQGW